MACANPRPTETLFGTSTSRTTTVSTSTSIESSTITRTTDSFSSSCTLTATAGDDEGECLGFTTIVVPVTSTEVTTIPHDFVSTRTIEVPVTFPTETRFAPCDDEPDDPPTSEEPPPTVTVTSTRTFTDSSGNTRTTEDIITTSSSLSPDPGAGSSSDNTGALIGGIVGGVVGLVAIIALVWYIIWRRKRYQDIFDFDEDIPPVTAAGVGDKSGGTINKKRFNVDDEATPYAYGVVGAPNTHSQHSSMAFNHGRSSSHTPLMASPPESPPTLMTNLPGGGHHARTPSMASSPQSYYPGQRPQSGYESMLAPSLVGASRPGTGGSGQALLGVPPMPPGAMNLPHQHYPPQPIQHYPPQLPPGHAGFYQQYGQESPYQEMHKPPMGPASYPVGPGPAQMARPMSAHEQQVSDSQAYSGIATSSIMDAPIEQQNPSAPASTAGSTGGGGPAGPGPVSAVEEKRRLAVVGSPPQSPPPPTQHVDAGRVPDGFNESGPSASNSAPPPAYSQ